VNCLFIVFFVNFYYDIIHNIENPVAVNIFKLDGLSTN